jgi:hypothetical protein
VVFCFGRLSYGLEIEIQRERCSKGRKEVGEKGCDDERHK